MLRRISMAAAVAGACGFAQGELVRVTVQGPVGFNVIQGAMAGIQPGTPVTMSFNVDSNVFTNSASFPTRGYEIILSSFEMKVGSVSVPIVDPQPSPPAYFVLRNNDPAVDGFFISSANVDFPFPLAVTIPGLAPQHELDFQVGYSNGNQINSLDILDAFGTYDLSAIGSFYWAIGRFGNAGAEYNYETITIGPVPEPAAGMLLGLAAVTGLSRRRQR